MLLFTEIDNSANQSQQQSSNIAETVTCNKSNKKQLCGGNKQAIEKMLEFGKQLYSQSVHLRQQYGKNESNKKMLQDAFSLLAYSNPWNSPVGWQLNPQERETVCARLNSAILGKRAKHVFATIMKNYKITTDEKKMKLNCLNLLSLINDVYLSYDLSKFYSITSDRIRTISGN